MTDKTIRTILLDEALNKFKEFPSLRCFNALVCRMVDYKEECDNGENTSNQSDCSTPKRSREISEAARSAPEVLGGRPMEDKEVQESWLRWTRGL